MAANADESGSIKLLEAAAQRSETSDADWPELRREIEQMLEKHIAAFRKDESALFDRAAKPPWPMDDDTISRATRRVQDLLELFKPEAPFTVQRLAELALSPQPHYTSLPKYLRALERCLLVSSSLAAFPTPAPPSGPSVSLINGGSARAGSASSPSTPLLSPIPFLVNRMNNAPGSPRVDELDLGEGTAEMEDVPVALTSTTAGEGVKSPPPVVESKEAEEESRRITQEMELDAIMTSKPAEVEE